MLTVRRASIVLLSAVLLAAFAGIGLAATRHAQPRQPVYASLRASDVDWGAWKGYKQPYVAPEPKPRPRLVAVADDSPDFWRRLANCESPDGRSGHFIGYFQFSPDTARSVGIDGSESYEEQRAAAQRWAAGVNPGSTAGWPVCWWRALR